MSDLRIVLLGKSMSENSGVGNFILGRAAFDSEAPPDVVERVGGRLKDRRVMVINSPQLLHTHISDHQITQTVRECVYLSDPGPHVIVLLLKHEQCSAEDQECVEKVLDSFSERVYQHTMVLTTQEPTETNDILQKIIQKCCNRHFSLQGSSSPDDLLQTFEDIEQMNDGRHLDCAEASQCFTMKQQDTERLSEGEKLNLVVCGSDGTLKSSISERILQQKDRRSGVDLHGRVISLVELPALFNTRLSEEEVMRQTLRCVSLCHPGVHVFLLIIPDAPLNNEDKAEMEEIQRIFSSRINKHIMILIMQNSEHQTAELNEETQSVIERFGGRHHFFGPNTQVSTLMENIEKMLEENRGEFFSRDTFLEAQMKKLMKYEEMKKKINSLETPLQLQGSRENANELRIVLLGKTGVGKSAAGNTILGRNAFTAETSQESVTKESKRETSDINGRHVTVIDTPGLFDTELTNEEIQREIRHCISMILPGPHVFIIVLNLGQRFTREEATSVKIIQETFGEKSLMFTMVLFTRGDDLKDKTIEQCLGKPGSALMKLIEECGNRYHVFNNNQTGDRTQVSDLLEKIDAMLNANGGSFYSCKMFRQMEREKQEEQMKILMDRVRETEELVDKLEEEKERIKMMMEEERHNHDKERKRSEELKRKIREQEKHQREIRDEMRRERETFKHEIEEMRQEKENVKKEKENLQITHDTEINRLMNRIENERLNHGKERNRREEEFNERVERYKTLMKEKEESEEKMHEEMKRERETFKHEIEEMRQEKENVKKEKENLQIRYDTEIDRLMNRIENERQNHETERKRREEEFNARVEQYKTLMKEKEEREEKMREEMRTERETFKHEKEETRQEKEKIKTEKDQLQMEIDRLMKTLENDRQNHETERNRREEEFKEREEQSKIEMKEKELMKMYEEEKERMKMMMEEERQNHDEERKRREDEFSELKEQYKTIIKEREEKESKMLEQMKLERMQLQKPEQDERQKREEEKKKEEQEKQKSEHLKKQSPVTDHTMSLAAQLQTEQQRTMAVNLRHRRNNAEAPLQNNGNINIVLLGKTGVGKSSSGNTILGENRFPCGRSLSAVTGRSSVQRAEINGRSVSVIDTPGFFCPYLPQEKLSEEFANSVYLSAPGVHAFLFVVQFGRFTEEVEDILTQVQKVYGKDVLKHVIILFTYGDECVRERKQAEIDGNELVRRVVEKCHDYHVFNNRDLTDRDQVNDLLKKIDTMIEWNQGFYTNEMYECAQMTAWEKLYKKIFFIK